MKNFLVLITSPSPLLNKQSHLFIRISFGVILLIFGYGKLTLDSAHITQLGSAMGLFGINFGYLFWGYLAALTEFCAGIAFITGFLTRIACIPLMWLLIVAINMHLHKGDTFTTWGFALTCLCITISFFISGSGAYSIDKALHSFILKENQ